MEVKLKKNYDGLAAETLRLLTEVARGKTEGS
mgnify:CR=1 FL=1